MAKRLGTKIQVIRINIVLFLFLLLYVVLLPPPFQREEAKATLVQFSLSDRRLRKVESSEEVKPAEANKTTVTKKIPIFGSGIPSDANVGLVNIGEDEVEGWRAVEVKFQKVSKRPRWKKLFPEWIDEEEVKETPSCPEIPMPDFSQYAEVDAVVARLPCRYPKAGWARDVFRLQVHLAAANLAAWRARRDGGGRVKLAFLSSCQPMMELFRIDDLVAREGDWWLYESDLRRLQLKVAMPVGSCRLALPLRGESPNSVADQSQREAYATVLHSSESYVCGAIVLAHSIRRSGSRRDLVLLHDKSLSDAKRRALAAGGWKLRMIKRIRNPHAKKFTYNEYNYSKLRLWLLTDYDKVVFVDADAAVLRNVDHLFEMPEMSAAGNDGVLFNSGVMVIEPSNATFSVLMKRRDEIVSYNGGDQGFLNEAFVWWHRLSHNVNYLKIFPENTTSEALHKNRLFGADPPELHVVHYLGQKPWLCYRDYDCNWNIPGGVIYASDEAHRTWWRLHDNIAPALRRFCRLPQWRKSELNEERKAAEAAGNPDGHWKIEIADRRRRWERQ